MAVEILQPKGNLMKRSSGEYINGHLKKEGLTDLKRLRMVI